MTSLAQLIDELSPLATPAERLQTHLRQYQDMCQLDGLPQDPDRTQEIRRIHQGEL